MTDQGHINNFRLNLKRLASQNRLSLDDLKTIVEFCGAFFNQNLPQKFGKSFNCPFLIEGFAGKTFRLARGNKIESQEKIIAELTQDSAIDQKQKEKIIAELKKQQNKILEENLFLSDLIAFLEQSNVQLAKFLDQDKKQALAKLGSDFFNRIGLAGKASLSQIPLKELQKLEQTPSIWKRVDSDLAQPMLAIIFAQEQKFEEKKEEKDKKKDQKSQPSDQEKKKKESGQTTETEEEEGQDSESEKEEPKQTLPEEFSKEFNLARLDDHSKLYIRSLAIISINQSLQIQFANLSKEQLREMGFDSVPNFNQLSIDTRQQLLSISFAKIENLLASGRYDLAKLINAPSLRIGFSKEIALKVMTDIHGGEVFAREIGQLTQSDLSPEQSKKQLENNQKQGLTQEQLKKLKINLSTIPASLKDQLENLSSEEAEKFFKQLDSQKELKDDFLTNIKHSFSRVTKNNFLSEWQKIVVNDKNAVNRSFLARENILPVIDVFIQQNYPADYIEHLNWQRFQAHFGNDVIQQNTFLANERAIKDLLTCYWKSQRAEWSHTIHQGIDNEFYSTEDLDKLWQDFDQSGKTKEDKKNQQKRAIYFQQIQHQARLNLIDAEAVSKKMAGFDQEMTDLRAFNQSQIDDLNYLNAIYQQSFLDIINGGSQTTQRVVLTYYLPGTDYLIDNQTLLQASSLPQFSAYDLGALNYNQAFGPDENGEYPLTRTLNHEGGIENQLKGGFNAVKNQAGQAMDFLGEKAVRAGLDYATGGAFESLPEPIKQIIEQMAWGAIKKTLEPILKLLIALMLAALSALLALIFKALSFFGIGGGVKEVSPIIAKKSIWSKISNTAEPLVIPEKYLATPSNQLAERAAAQQSQVAAHTQAQPISQALGSNIAQIGQGAMATASQAVLTAFGLAAGGMLIYQTVLNGAFLTQFPTGGHGGGGTAVFCDDVVVGNLTYYSQKDYNNIPICGGSCTFGSSSCGPVAISMILNENPIEMSTREGFLVPGGCGLTSCSGTAPGPLVSSLSNNGFNVVSVPTPSGSPGQITDELSQYLAEGNLIFALTHTRGFGHYYVITCVESPGYLTAYDPWWGQNVVHKVVSTSAEGLITGTDNTYIRNMWLVQN